MILPSSPIEATAFEASNSRSYLSAVFDAWRRGEIIASLPRGQDMQTVPGVVMTSRQSFDPDPGWYDETLTAPDQDSAAQIAFSSGTTGRPKALLLSHRAQWDVVRRINEAMELDATIREYVGIPVTFSFGFGRVRAVAAAGGCSFLPANGFDPSEIATLLRGGEINAVSAVPTLWRVVLANPDIIGEAGKALRWIEIGSQYMSGAEKAALRGLFPNAKIVQHYGLTEASRSTLLDISEAPKERLDSVGRATGDVQIALQEDGAIRINGPHLASGRITEAGLEPVVGKDGWLVTSDRGRIEDGWLYYEGRMDELINSGGIKIDPTQFEQRLAAELGQPDAVAVGRVTDAMRGEQVLVALAQGAGLNRARTEQAALKIAESYGLAGKGALAFREIADIPRTETGKVRRAALADLPDLSTAAKAQPHTAPAPEAGKAAELQAVWGEILGMDTVPLDKSFYDIGGDSLSALTAILKMEALGLDPDTARGIFEGKTIAEIADMAGFAPEATPAPEQVAALHPEPGLTLAETVNSVHAVRGVLVLWVVMVHWLPGVLERLGENFIWIYDALMPALRFGTPGFALVFGIGIGALRLHHYTQNPALAVKGVRFNTRLVVGGVLVLALLKAGVLMSEGQLFTRMAPSTLFYSAISYYALAMLTLPWLLGLLSLGKNPLLNILLVCASAMVINELLQIWLAPAQPSGLLELLKILVTAKYGFFRMTGYALVGAAIGWLLQHHHSTPGLPRVLLLYGIAMITFGALMLYQAAPGNVAHSFNTPDLWHVVFYAGFVVLLAAGFTHLNRDGGKGHGRALKQINAFAIASGILALPIFVGHEMVIPAKTLLHNLGLPELLALVLCLGVFLIALGIAYARLMRLLTR